ncbi:branched-chain amino acid ABC transporter permease [Ruixingdingia sedimenti]|uniref:Branched-chain amino acid ABC transporter permease n=1 Tax=Ruixingdingia sedimenti TaxID=3073604 RepID=A0ABU1FCL8_9RHOB|nr:branched-chain amino acid ABC transporter permease [Xinfangfangia sp. LG-4]MDR5654592.1 branched-chain amino acid ABC transporter permease [Xinfangfangia sp. LG-4]
MTMAMRDNTAPSPLREAIARAAPLAVLMTGLLALVLLAGMGDIVTQRRVILCLINVTVVVGLYIFMGNSGVLNFSAVGFMAVGAYAAALLTMPPMLKNTFLPDLPGWLAAAELPLVAGPFAGGLVAAVLALAVGGPIMRLSGIAAGIATFSLMFIIYIVLGNWNSVTGGQTSLMGLKGWVGLWPAGLFAIGAVALAWIYQETRWAIALRASREDQVAARASGIRVVRLRLGAFVLGAFTCGVGGGLYGHFQGTLRVENFYLDPTFLYVAMLVVGGTRSLTGAVIGTVTVAALSEALRQVESGLPLPGTGLTLTAPAGLGDVVLAGLMLVILIYRPQGITGGREITALFRRKT